MGKIKVSCSLCKLEFNVSQSRYNTKSGLHFCCREHKDKAQRIESGFTSLHPPHYGDGSYYYRKIAFRFYLHKCELCGYDKITKILEVHHIDKNRKNNNIINLIILCPICHRILTLKLGYLENRKLIYYQGL
jgi:hypothetical protein